jgi:hypothetical protein
MPFAAALPLVVPQETRKEDGSNGAAFAFKPFPVPFSFVRIDKLGTACVLKELLVPPKGPTTGAVIVHIIVIVIGVGVVVVVAVVAAPQVAPNEEVLRYLRRSHIYDNVCFHLDQCITTHYLQLSRSLSVHYIFGQAEECIQGL